MGQRRLLITWFFGGAGHRGAKVIHQLFGETSEKNKTRSERARKTNKANAEGTSQTPPPMSKSLIFGFLCARIKMGITISKCLLMIYSTRKTAAALEVGGAVGGGCRRWVAVGVADSGSESGSASRLTIPTYIYSLRCDYRLVLVYTEKMTITI